MTEQEIKVSGDRIGALIGKSGSTKRELEEKTKAVLEVDSKEGSVKVSGDDAEGVLTAIEVIKAINRGFSLSELFTSSRTATRFST